MTPSGRATSRLRRRRSTPPSGAIASRSSLPNASAPANRSSGRRDNALATARSTPSGTSLRTRRSGGGVSANRRASITDAVAPENGISPASISQSTQASEYWSERPSMSVSPAACSGLMYAGVPTIVPVWVSRGSTRPTTPPPACPPARPLAHPPARPSATRCAIPKSATSACPAASMMFSGLMSRWITPWRWAYSRASAASRAIWTASSTGSCVSRASRWRSVSPSTNGMANQSTAGRSAVAGSSPESWTARM